METPNMLGHVNRHGLFIKWNYKIKNQYYIGAEYSRLIADKHNTFTNNTINIYSICAGKTLLKNRIGFEVKCDYVSITPKWMSHFNNFIILYVKI